MIGLNHKFIDYFDSKKYEHGDFGYFWTHVLGKEDIRDSVFIGDVNVGEAGLTSLKGCPTTVMGDFSCYGNELRSLRGSPKFVSGHFCCNGNKLSDLEGGPNHVGGSYFCNNIDWLACLKGSPLYVGRSFVFNSNVASCIGRPSHVGKVFEGTTIFGPIKLNNYNDFSRYFNEDGSEKDMTYIFTEKESIDLAIGGVNLTIKVS